MFIPKQWLFLFGISFTFGLALVWLFMQNALLNAEVSSLENDVVSLEVDVVSLEDDVETLQGDVAALQSAGHGSDNPPATQAALTNAQVVVPTLADGTPIGSIVVLDVETGGVPHALRAALAPRAAALDTDSYDEHCVFPTDGTQNGAQGGGDSGGGSAESEVTIEANNEIGNYATNSGNIIDSFFLDGGQGDIGINVVESVLTGVNFNIIHQSGNNTLDDSGNTNSAAVMDNTPTLNNEPSYSDVELSAPVAVSGTIDSSNAVRGEGNTSPASSGGSLESSAAVITTQNPSEREVAIVRSDGGSTAVPATGGGDPDTVPPAPNPAGDPATDDGDGSPRSDSPPPDDGDTGAGDEPPATPTLSSATAPSAVTSGFTPDAPTADADANANEGPDASTA